jgi:hypothetical protein
MMVGEHHPCPEQVRHLGARPGPADDRIPATRYEPAITKSEKANGRWWGHNDEYATEISFCPWCGTELT